MIPDSIYHPREAESRSISAENPDGRRGGGARADGESTLMDRSWEAARDLGVGWKCSPCKPLEAGETFVFADIEGPGVIRHIWITTQQERLRNLSLRVYWDGADEPAICCPLGDFFCQAWNQYTQLDAIPINVNSRGGMNCYLPMPFRRHARLVVTNDGDEDVRAFFYTVNYTLEAVTDDACYLQASWRRENPTVPGRDLVIAEDIAGRGHFVGCFLAWQQNSQGWWGEGEVKMFTDDDGEYPTICGTGTEDYFGGAWGFGGGDYSAPYLGFWTVRGENRQVGARMGMYRFHLPDPIHFRERLKVTCQCLGWRSGHRFLQLQDDIAATAWWYQQWPMSPVPELPGPDDREQI